MNDSNESRDIYQLTSNKFDNLAVFGRALQNESLSTATVVLVILDLDYSVSKQKDDMFDHMTGKCKLLGLEGNPPPDTSYLSLMFVIRYR